MTHAVAEAGEQTDVGTEAVDAGRGRSSTTSSTTTSSRRRSPRTAASELNLHHPGLTERVATFGRSPIVTLALCALFGAFIAAAIVFVTPADAVLVAKQVLVWLTLGLLGLTVVYGAVHGIAWLFRRKTPQAPPLMPQTDLAILNWRREKSVFLGTNQPQEDASWIFQLRMAELERAKSGRTSEPRPWQRLGARLFDYAIWGLVLALLLSELQGRRRRARERRVLARPSARRAVDHHLHLGADRSAADRVARDDAGQVAVRRLPAVLDLRRLRAARLAHAVRARPQARVPRLVGRPGHAASRCSRRS